VASAVGRPRSRAPPGPPGAGSARRSAGTGLDLLEGDDRDVAVALLVGDQEPRARTEQDLALVVVARQPGDVATGARLDLELHLALVLGPRSVGRAGEGRLGDDLAGLVDRQGLGRQVIDAAVDPALVDRQLGQPAIGQRDAVGVLTERLGVGGAQRAIPLDVVRAGVEQDRDELLLGHVAQDRGQLGVGHRSRDLPDRVLVLEIELGAGRPRRRSRRPSTAR
jgi:hypothetical protein